VVEEASMDGPGGRPGWEGELAPRGLLLGCALSFLACCALGRAVSRHNPYKNFERFHEFINYLSLYYPTVAQTRAIARSALAPDQVAVVLGGNSILYGGGQGDRLRWTRRLQALLGPRYRVLNFAFPGARPADVGPVAAEVIQRDHARVIFVTNNWAGTAEPAGDVDGVALRYFFWGAYYKGLLARAPERDARVAEMDREVAGGAPLAELRRGARLDGWLYQQDLWTTFSYRCASSVWCPAVAGSFTAPRRRYASADPELPPDLPHPPEQDREVLADCARRLPGCRWPEVPAGADGPDYSGTPLVRSFKVCVPAPFRRRTLVVINRLNPKYVRQLPPAVQAGHAADYGESVRALEQAGFAALDVGRDYAPRDYTDFCHFSWEGGYKMAADVAPKVRQMARDLGYID
jgi:hypothetical protein